MYDIKELSSIVEKFYNNDWVGCFSSPLWEIKDTKKCWFEIYFLGKRLLKCNGDGEIVGIKKTIPQEFESVDMPEVLKLLKDTFGDAIALPYEV